MRLKSLSLLASAALLATAAPAQLAEFNATNAAARAARESGDHAALLVHVRKLAALVPGHPSVQVALARALALGGDRAGAVAQLDRIADLGISFAAADDVAPVRVGVEARPVVGVAVHEVRRLGEVVGPGRRLGHSPPPPLVGE